MKGGIYMIIFLRKILKYKYYGVIMVIVICIGCAHEATAVLADEALHLYSTGYALTDGRTGRVLMGKNETSPMANASTTKILTCIIALENCALNERVTISAYAAAQPKVRLGMAEGEVYTLKDLLYGLMLESYNDCAVAIAEHIAGSVEGFADVMNQKAVEIGCENTYFLTPNGLDAEKGEEFHHTTAIDLCKIMKYCVWESPQKEAFLKITQTKEYSDSLGTRTYTFINRNALLDQIDGLLSGKTGYTAKAGYCYVAAYEKNGERYCVALLACGWPNNKTWKWIDTAKILNYAVNNYDMKKVTIQQIKEQLVVDGYVSPPQFSMLNKNDILEIIGEQQEYTLLLGEGEEIIKEVVLYRNVSLPIDKKQEMGVCNIYVEDMLLDVIPLVSNTESGEWNLSNIMYVILCQFFTFSS